MKAMSTPHSVMSTLPSAFPSNISDDVSTSLPVNNNSYIPEGCLVKKASQFVAWDNEDNLIPKQVEVIMNVLLTGIGVPLCVLVGFPTNILNIVVFWKQGLKVRINMCLFTLSVVDLIYCLSAIGYASDVLYMFVIGKGDKLGPSAMFFARNYLMGVTGIVNSSQITTSVIALERCLCVTRPLLAKQLLPTKPTAIVLWCFLLITTGGVFVCGGMRYTVICVFDLKDNSTFFQLYGSEFYFQNQLIIHIFSGIVYGLLIPGLCATCVTVCTVITVIEMKKLSQWRETASSSSDSTSSRDLALNRMIVGTSILFIICMIPTIIFRACVVLVPDMRPGFLTGQVSQT
ncbi:uncharacterized protein LOC143300827 [Babylonia areolata]|uniref:uncharacterized protein LOC143300827 n=1 Tax=Babylonia areolata TaxID=304850 RepID=UPI003FD30157